MRWRSDPSGQTSNSSATCITNMCVLHWFCWEPGLPLVNSKMPKAGSSSVPLTPASSMVSRLAASSTDSSSSQPPLGSPKPFPPRLDTSKTCISPPSSKGARRTGMHPAHSLSPPVSKRCLCLPILARRTVGTSVACPELGSIPPQPFSPATPAIAPFSLTVAPVMLPLLLVLALALMVGRTKVLAHAGLTIDICPCAGTNNIVFYLIPPFLILKIGAMRHFS
mmetsp:Transcript_17251/g.47846  ORF Transcript_17251/g.47846 Transcript_17251/m.47846 type:complete len:223 (-) Transcript_17251:567-1235(-)